MATYIEACAFPGSEPAFLQLNGDGTVTLSIGTQTNGQGHATAYSQFVAEKLNIDISKVIVHQGDTDRLKAGGGTGGSRSIPLGGVSAARAGEDLAEKIKRIAADELEASAADIELVDGTARIVGTDRSMDFAAIAKAAKKPSDLEGFGEFVQDECTYPNGTHICEVEIDPDTGATEIVNYTIVDDFGVTVNPILLAGQVHGGVVQGIGQALTEDTVYGEDGQLLTASFMDYADAARRPRAVLPFRDAQRAVDHQRARHQGRRRGRHDRRGARRAQRRDRRALPRLRHPPHRDAGHADAHLERHSGSEISGLTSQIGIGTCGSCQRQDNPHDLHVMTTADHDAEDKARRDQHAHRHRAEGRFGGDLRRHGHLHQARPANCRPARSCSSAPSSRSFRCWRCLPGAASCARALSTSHPFSHIARGIVGVGAMSLGFFALTRLPLPEAITLNYAQPLLVVVFSALFLGETIRVYRWSAVAVGLIGVVIISWPKLTLFSAGAGVSDREAIGVVAALASACDLGGGAAAGAPAGAHREIGDHRAVVLADGQRAGAAVDPVRLAGADAGSRRRC